MAYILPDFNLTCDIYTGPWLTKVFRLSSDCNLAIGRRVMFIPFDWANQAPTYAPLSQLLLPPLTDVQDASVTGEPDIIECPAGSGRWYRVAGVDDMGKGFPNEHRFAMISKIYEQLNNVAFAGLQWPNPIP